MIPVRWGVLGVSEGVGRQAVLPAIQASPRATLEVIGSRSPERARAEAARFGSRWAGSYEAVLADPAVEAVYLPLPNEKHAAWVAKAAAAGKHILCEKPLGRDLAECEAMLAMADAAGVHLVQAWMAPFHPRMQAVLAALRDGLVGDVRVIRAEFTFPLQDPGNYRWQAEQGGGALLDVGIYVLGPVLDLWGEPDSVTARQRRRGDVDATTQALLGWADGRSSTVLASFELPERQAVEFSGDAGRVLVDDEPFTGREGNAGWTVTRADGRREDRTGPADDSYRLMVEHASRRIRGEAVADPGVGIGPMYRTLDRIRAAAYAE